MSLGELKFMDKYKDDYLLFLVTSVKDDFPNVEIFTPDKISHLKKISKYKVLCITFCAHNNVINIFQYHSYNIYLRCAI